MTIERAFSLEGLNIGITALDLEQNEHRGIAQVAKNVISGLTSEKANVFLITSYGGLALNQNLGMVHQIEKTTKNPEKIAGPV